MDLKIKDVAELLNVSETTIRRWITDDKIPIPIPVYRINHQYRFSRIEIEDWIMRCKLKSQETGSSLFNERQIYPPVEEKESHEIVSRGGMQHFCLYRAIHQGDLFSTISGKTKEEIIRGTT